MASLAICWIEVVPLESIPHQIVPPHSNKHKQTDNQQQQTINNNKTALDLFSLAVQILNCCLQFGRKPMMFLPCIGSLLQQLGILLVIYLDLALPWLYLPMLCYGFFGTYALFLMSLFTRSVTAARPTCARVLCVCCHCVWCVLRLTAAL